jgi:hypothetical protein
MSLKFALLGRGEKCTQNVSKKKRIKVIPKLIIGRALPLVHTPLQVLLNYAQG